MHNRLVLAALFILLLPNTMPADERGWTSESKLFRVTFESTLDPIVINQIHQWVLRVNTIEGEAVTDAQIDVDGGMPAHNHGLPTRPRVTAKLGDGQYRIEGLRFHMGGQWELRIRIKTATAEDTVIVRLSL